MAWLGLDLDDTLVQKAPNITQDPETGMEMEAEPTGEEEDVPTEGSVEFCMQMQAEGHRLTIFTARFKAMPESEKQRLKEQIEQELQGMGFPPMEVWTGTTKPDFDFYIGNKAINYDNDWHMVLAQLRWALTESGLEQPQPDPNDAPQEGEEGPPPEEA